MRYDDFLNWRTIESALRYSKMFGGIVTNLAFMSLFLNDHPVIERSNIALASTSHSSSITALHLNRHAFKWSVREYWRFLHQMNASFTIMRDVRWNDNFFNHWLRKWIRFNSLHIWLNSIIFGTSTNKVKNIKFVTFSNKCFGINARYVLFFTNWGVAMHQR